MSDNSQELKAKIEALAAGATTEGERAAAEAALERIKPGPPPPPGSVEWRAACLKHQRIIAECLARLGNPSLTPAEVRIVRNFGRYVGYPWESGAVDLRRIHAKLMAAEEDDNPAPIALAYEPAVTVDLK